MHKIFKTLLIILLPIVGLILVGWYNIQVDKIRKV